MFADLLDENIQPEEIDIKHLPEIEISENLRNELERALEEEEDKFAKVSGKTAIVQTDKKFVFFSNQWLYLAVCCKKYAEALKPYGDFFDGKIRGNKEIIDILVEKRFSDSKWITLIPDEVDRERMVKFVESDAIFRPGKALLNGDKIRTVKDIFGSCILKKLPVPDASSAYLGNLIYYLTKRTSLYDALEIEVKNQVTNTEDAIELPSTVKECAKAIMDCIYEFDGFEKLSGLLENTGKNVKISTVNQSDLLPVGNFLRYVFTLPNSDMYNPDSTDKTRVFEDKEYVININEESVKCRLTTEWVGTEISAGGTGNYLDALILIVNKYYEGIIEIKTELGGKYLYKYLTDFKLKDLPEILRTDFPRRYITSLLAKPFVILTGNSGTGKTRISKQFAEYLERQTGDGKKNWAIIPVGADWTDNAKVLGFFNPLANDGKGEYVNTKIVELLEQANTHPQIPFFLILDEMNLSHVERYFSDFLSHMEIPDYPFELDGYGKVLKFPENLFVVGTVNIDETTYMFSPKVLDRANVVEFKPEKDTVLNLFTAPVNNGRVSPANNGSAEAFLELAKEIRAGRCNEKIDFEAVKEIFDTVYTEVEKQGFEFAYRTVREIRQYISAAYEISDEEQSFDVVQAIDEQLLQKVLPKIHGNKKEIGELLGELEKICGQNENKLELSGKKIEQMKGKLVKVQYASFI